MRRIDVRPMGSGWMIQVDAVQNPQVFKSGRRAETAAKALAGRLADSGEDAEVSVYLRDGSIAGRFVNQAAL